MIFFYSSYPSQFLNYEISKTEMSNNGFLNSENSNMNTGKIQRIRSLHQSQIKSARKTETKFNITERDTRDIYGIDIDTH